jgi:signal transduction histidine kinase
MVKNYLKRFTEWVIGLKNNLFLWARLKLTFLYIAFIATILITFSASLYLNIAKNVNDKIKDKVKGDINKQLVIQQTDTHLKESLITEDLIIILFFGGLAFFLAGKNLRPIQNVLEKQKRFTADASHDLRTPLAIMKTDCEVELKRDNLSQEEACNLLKSNLEEVNRMSVMVEQLLFLSRNDKKPNQEMEAISLEMFTRRIVKRIKVLAENKNIDLSISETQEGEIMGNELDLEKMFFNIIKNAIDYTPSGGKIGVSVHRIKNKMKLCVQDSGIGIAHEDLPHITEPFYKADKVRTGESMGSGLGLSIVKEIVKNHNGKMTITSQPGVGTEISIIFPILLS